MIRKKPVIDEFDECSGCGLTIWRCTVCGKDFLPSDKVYCINNGEEHLCLECFKST